MVNIAHRHRQTRDVIPMMNNCQLSVVDGGPTLIQQCSDVQWLTGMPHVNLATYRYMCGERRDVTMTCGRVFSTNHSEPTNDWQLNQQWQHVYDQMFDKTVDVFYYTFTLLGAKQSSCVCHQQAPFTGVKLWGPLYILLIQNYYYGWWLAPCINWPKY